MRPNTFYTRTTPVQDTDLYGNVVDKELVIEQVSYQSSSRNSPRVDGKLKLQANPYSLSKEFISCVPGIIGRDSLLDGKPPCRIYQTQPLYMPFADYDQDLTDQTVARFYEKSIEMKANIADLYRTRAETVDMISDNVIALANSYRSLRRGDFRRAARFLKVHPRNPVSKDIAGRWLELQYGWLPLLSDVYNLCEDKPTISGWKRVHRVVDRSIPEYVSMETDAIAYTVTRCELHNRCTVGAFLTVKDSAVRRGSEYGLTNPALLAWEAIPFSFVVDWFLPVGSYLEALTALEGLEVSEASVTTTATVKFTVVGKRGKRATEQDYPVFKPSVTVGEKTTKLRELGLPSRPLPTFENPLTPLHFTNALALLRSAFR